VWSALSDQYGYLWFGTQGGGLARYDGSDFNIYNGQQGLASNYIHCLYEDPKNQLWVGTSRGLSYREGKRFRTVKGGKTQVNCLTNLPDGRLLVGTANNLLMFDPYLDSLRQFNARGLAAFRDREILAFLQIDNELLIGTDAGLYRLTSSRRLIAVDRVPRQHVYALALNKEKDACWIGIYGEGILKLSLPGLLPVDTIALSEVSYPFHLLSTEDGGVWVASQNRGLSRLGANGKLLEHYEENNGLPHNHLRQLVFDAEDQLWVASSGGGVARCLPLEFRRFGRRDGLAGNRVYDVLQRQNDDLLVAVSRRGVQLLDSTGRFQQLDLGSKMNGVKCKTIAEDSLGRIYVGTEGNGIAVWDSSRLLQVNTRSGLPGDWILQIAATPANDIWIATFADGLARLRWRTDSTYRIKRYGLRQGLPSLRISSLELDPNGQVWAASREGYLTYFPSRGLPRTFAGEQGLPGVEIPAIGFDTSGRIWIAAKGKGLYWARWQEDELFFQPYRGNDQLTSYNFYLLQPTSEALWVGTETGVDRINFEEDGTPTVTITHYGREEGFLGVENCHAAVTSPNPDGQLWFGTMNGLMSYLPGQGGREIPPPQLHFGSISLFYRPLHETPYAAFVTTDNRSATQQLPHRQNHLSFAYRAVELTYPDRVRYRNRLITEEEQDSVLWAPPTQSTEVSYAGLAPGDYTFEVQATHDGENWSAPLIAQFSIAAPFWQQTWFQWLIGVVSLLFVIGLIGLVVWRVKRREARRRERLETENRLLQLEQKALQLQMNPHFIFNALTSIRGLIGTADEVRAKQEINRFASLMRGILNNSRAEKISLTAELDVLKTYLAVEQFCQAKRFEFTITVAPEIDPEEVELPPMLLQPFVENAVVHGVAHLQRAGKIDLHFDLSHSILVVRILDNGIGREASSQLKKTKRPGHQSVALSVTKERLEALRNNRGYRSLIVQDRLNGNGRIAGTEVIVKLPVEVW
ncbi:MAG: two-component regulator propeller domain-containing protein, partial [Bacteroidota bacterium]